MHMCVSMCAMHLCLCSVMSVMCTYVCACNRCVCVCNIHVCLCVCIGSYYIDMYLYECGSRGINIYIVLMQIILYTQKCDLCPKKDGAFKRTDSGGKHQYIFLITCYHII